MDGWKPSISSLYDVIKTHNGSFIKYLSSLSPTFSLTFNSVHTSLSLTLNPLGGLYPPPPNNGRCFDSLLAFILSNTLENSAYFFGCWTSNYCEQDEGVFRTGNANMLSFLPSSHNWSRRSNGVSYPLLKYWEAWVLFCFSRLLQFLFLSSQYLGYVVQTMGDQELGSALGY